MLPHPEALIQTLIYFTPMMGIDTKSGTLCDSSSSYHRLVAILSLANNLCNLGIFSPFGPGMLNAERFNNTLLIYEGNRLWKTLVTLLPELPWIALPE